MVTDRDMKRGDGQYKIIVTRPCKYLGVWLWKESQHHKVTEEVAPELQRLKTESHSFLGDLHFLCGEKLGYNIAYVCGRHHYLSTPVKACTSLKGQMKWAYFSINIFHQYDRKITHKQLDMKQQKSSEATGRQVSLFGSVVSSKFGFGNGAGVSGAQT